MSDHPEITAFVDLARGVLADDEVAEILAHCRGCEQCDTDLAVVLLLRQEEDAAVPVTTPSKTSGGWRRWMALAATFVLGVAVGTIVPFGQRTVSDETARSAPVTEIPQNPFAGQPTTPQLLEILRIFEDVMGRGQPLESEQRFFTVREIKTGSWSPETVANAIRTFNDGDHEQAIAQLESLHAEHPYDPRIAGLLGMTLFEDGDRSDRVRDLLVLGLAQEGGNTAFDHVLMYMAWFYAERGNTEESLKILARIASVSAGYTQTMSEEIVQRVRDVLAGS